MALNKATLTNLMLASFGIFTPGAKDEFGSYAEGVIIGLKGSTVKAITSGKSGSPGIGKGIGAIQGGALTMVPIVMANSIGVMPPMPMGAPAPLQILWFLAVSQIATHVLTMLEVELLKTDGVAVGVGKVIPGGFTINADLIKISILAASLKKGLPITPMRIDVADVIAKSTKQMMALATMEVPIIGGSTGEGGSAGIRMGVIK